MSMGMMDSGMVVAAVTRILIKAGERFNFQRYPFLSFECGFFSMSGVFLYHIYVCMDAFAWWSGIA